MPLPILDVPYDPSPTDLLRLFHRTSRLATEQLAEPAPLDVGTAYVNPELPLVHNANLLHDAALPAGTAPADAVASVNAHFASRGVRCWKWIMNPSAPTPQTAPLIAHLESIGYRPHAMDVMILRRAGAAPAGAPPAIPGLKIIPSRAGFRHAATLYEQAAARWGGGDVARQLVDAHLRRLEDPHYDELLALLDGAPAAAVGVLSAGDLGRIDNLFVAAPFRRRGIGRTLLARALEICARSLFKHVFLDVAPDNAAALHLYEQFGFARLGRSVEYQLEPA